MRRLWKILKWILAVGAVLLLTFIAGAYLYMRQSLPRTAGDLKAPGLTAPVEIIRDQDAVPHIFASNQQDALFALGYVHAQDRLWQMEFQRRLAQGRLSEMFGASTIGADKFLRILSAYRAAQQDWTALSPDARGLVQAYVNGLNAFITKNGGAALPPEFKILRIQPEPWSGPDVLVWAKMMAFNLSGTSDIELLRADLTRKVGAERADQLLPDSPASDLAIVSHFTVPSSHGPKRRAAVEREMNPGDRELPLQSYGKFAGQIEAMRVLIQGDERAGSGIGSNSWVVDGTKSTTGKPLLANDPHLAAQIPSLWYMVHLSAGDMDVIGATIPGLPGVVIGRNQLISWGITNLFPDTQDFFREKLDPSGKLVEFQGRMEPLQIVSETIKVKGQGSVPLEVRITRHGPLLSDAFDNTKPGTGPAPSEPLALCWTATQGQDSSVAALLELDVARNWDQFQKAVGHFSAPALSFVYADVEGNIGFYGAGRIPIRRSGDGSSPAEGWSGANDWIGWVPEQAAPRLFNPPEHFIVTANNRPVPPDYPYFLGNIWEKPYRAERITELLSGKEKLTPDDMGLFQADTVSLQAKDLLPELLAVVVPDTEEERRAIESLRQWDGNMKGQSSAAAIFSAWYRRLPEAMVTDELGKDLARRYEGWNDLFVARFLAETFKGANPLWCTKTGRGGHKDCGSVARQALRLGLDDLKGKMGADRDKWSWSRMHKVVFSHQPFGRVPWIGGIFNRSIATGGDNSTVDLGAFGFNSFEQHAASNYRQIVDLASSGGGRFIVAVGQSGHLLSPHYDDYLNDWQAVRYRPMRFGPSSSFASSGSVLRLEP